MLDESEALRRKLLGDWRAGDCRQRRSQLLAWMGLFASN